MEAKGIGSCCIICYYKGLAEGVSGLVGWKGRGTYVFSLGIVFLLLISL